MTASIHPLPVTPQTRARLACRVSVSAGPQSNAYGFPPVAPCIEITAGLRKVYAVRIDGVIQAEFDSLSIAARVSAAFQQQSDALQTLSDYGLLDRVILSETN